MSSTEVFAIPVRPDTSGDHTVNSLQNVVQQMVKQKGAFRSVTENSLTEDIVNQHDVSSTDRMDVTAEESTELVEKTQEKLLQVKNDMSNLIGTMQNELLSLLDAMSLPLSKSFTAAASTMSPALKQHAPVGSVRLAHVESTHRPAKDVANTIDMSDIIRLEQFSKCSNTLSEATSRLKKESERQAKYWQSIADIKAAGWSISRLPRDSRVSVVHYGAQEARSKRPKYGRLQQDSAGDVDVEGMASSHQSVLCVLIYRNGQMTGQHRLNNVLSYGNDLMERLESAKEILFQEEMFDEILQEARTISNMGVRSYSTAVIAEISESCSLKICSRDTRTGELDVQSPDDNLAAYIGHQLENLLLAECHARNRQRTSQDPASTINNQIENRPSTTLRPLLARLRHEMMIKPLTQLMSKYQQSFGHAQLSLEVSQDGETQDDVFTSSNDTTTTKLSIALSSAALLEASIRTRLGPPEYGTIYSWFSVYKNSIRSDSIQTRSNATAMIDFMEDTIARAVADILRERHRPDISWDRDEARIGANMILNLNTQPVARVRVVCSESQLVVYFHHRSNQDLDEAVIWSEHGSQTRRPSGEVKDDQISFYKAIDSWIERCRNK